MTAKPVAVIMGGTYGIGAVIAKTFSKAGYAVAIGGRSASRRAAQSNFLAVPVDAARKTESEFFIRKVMKHFGKIDVYIHCAGISKWRSLENIDESFLQQIMEVNVFGAFWGLAAAARSLKRGGAIVNVSSLAGKRGSARNSAYCSTKFALNGLTQALAKELGPRGIRVNAVCPVYVPTPNLLGSLAEPDSPARGQSVQAYLKEFARTQTALGRLPTTAEVAAAVLFLAGPLASAITGQCLNVDCGVLPQ